MQIQTMSVVIGGTACNARCPYCISKTTPEMGVRQKSQPINWRNFKIACQLAENCGVSTVLLTGKGEPTIWSDDISVVLSRLDSDYKFPFKELQTNGILIEKGKCNLKEWYDLGLTTICLSMVHYKSEINKTIYQPHIKEGYMDMDRVIDTILKSGIQIRMSCVSLNGYIDMPNKLEDLSRYCKSHGVKQLTIRPMTKPDNIQNDVTKWIGDHHLTRVQEMNMAYYLNTEGSKILELAHGAIVYDLKGQNVCWSTCVTTNSNTNDIRQIIFFPSGLISYDWKYEAAVLLG